MVHLSENEGIENQVFVVTGGAGFVGAAICLELVRRGASQVRSIDCSTSSPWLPQLRHHGVVCVVGKPLPPLLTCCWHSSAMLVCFVRSSRPRAITTSQPSRKHRISMKFFAVQVTLGSKRMLRGSSRAQTASFTWPPLACQARRCSSLGVSMRST